MLTTGSPPCGVRLLAINGRSGTAQFIAQPHRIAAAGGMTAGERLLLISATIQNRWQK